MPKLPSSLDLGARPTPTPGAPSAGYNPTTGAETAPGLALARLGAEMGSSANEIYAAVKLEQDRNDTLRAEDAFNQLRERQLDLTIGEQNGFANLKGEKAVKSTMMTDYPASYGQAVKEIERYYDGWRSGPRRWTDDRFNHATQPVVGISWYEAVAYCRWLSQELGAEVRLPTQAEWERAARSTHGGDYPWGGDFDPARANTEESNLGRTSPVHMYPGGQTTEGVWDLAGNVWEWINDDPGRLKGGAYWNDAKSATASARYGYVPDFRDDDIGFRLVVVVPSSHG